MAISLAFRQRLEELVREYRQELASDSQESIQQTRFAELEDEACKVGDDLATALVEAVLAEQAAGSALATCCPRCGRVAPRAPEPESRHVETRRGPVAWSEPQYDCRHCRQAFFPSEPLARD